MFKNKIIPYEPYLKEYAKVNRKNMTLPEVLIWKQLKNKQFNAIDFHRQKPLINWIADFYSPEFNWNIEVDGKQHFLEVNSHRDFIRDNEFKNYNIYITRIPAISILNNLHSVMEFLNYEFHENVKNRM